MCRKPHPGCQQNPEAQQLLCPPTYRGRVRNMIREFGVRNRILPGLCSGQHFPRLLPTVQAVVAIGRRPRRQNREGFPARPTTSASHPNPIAALVVRLFTPLAVTNNRPIATHRAPPWQQSQGEHHHPGSGLFSSSGNAIKRIKAGVRPRP